LEPEQALSTLQEAGLPAIDSHLLSGFALPLLQTMAAQRRVAGARLPLLALNGPVGAGKSTLGRVLEALAPALGLRLIVASIDDLYLTWPQRQRQLAGNPFDVWRVPPGSHDLPLLLEALGRWRQSGFLRLPRFDKTLADGQGDRCGWREGPCDALVLEGWLMGCRALGPQALAAARAHQDLSRPGPDGAPALTAIEQDWLPHWDRQLQAYEPLWQACDGLWILRPRSWSLPRRWRFQAEARQRQSGGGWLKPAELDRVVRASLCSLPPLLYQNPLAADPQLMEGDLEPAGGVESGVLPVSGFPEPPGLAVISNLSDPSSASRDPGRQNNSDPSEPSTTLAAEPLSERPLLERAGDQWSAQLEGSVVAPIAAAGGLVGWVLPVQAVAVLDGRRRCLAIQRRRPQASPSVSSSLIG
jgi:D-glycerate 3-kinase